MKSKVLSILMCMTALIANGQDGKVRYFMQAPGLPASSTLYGANDEAGHSKVYYE